MSRRAAALAVACAGLWGAAPVAAEGAQPRLVLDTTHIDLGKVTGPAPVRATFPLRNTGDAPLEIQDLRASCGCIAALLSTPVLQPGEQGEVAVSLDPTRVSDRRTKIVTVYSNDPQRPVVYLKLSATVQPAVEVSRRVVHFGTAVGDAVPDQTLSVYPNPEAPLTLEEVTATSPLLSFTWTPTPDAKRPGYAITARLAAGLAPGIFVDTVTIRFAERGAPRVEIPVRAQIVGPVIMTPTVLGLGLARRGSSPTRSLHVAAPSMADFRIEKVESTSVHLVPTVATDPEAGGYRVALHVGQEAPRGPLQAVLRVYTNARAMPLVEVPVTAVVR